MKDSIAQYIANGWKVCRIQPGSKGPRDSDWNEPGQEIQTPEGFPLGWGVGLLHAWSGTMALDIDNYPVALKFLQERGIDLDALMSADDAVQISSGKVDSAKLLYACPPRPGKGCAPYPAVDKMGKPRTALALDFRCATASGNTQQDALPPTIHPGRGLPYVWKFGFAADWRVLPPLPAALEAVWDELVSPVINASQTVAAPTGAAPARIQAWLDTEDPGMTRTDWVVVGMKLHAEYLGSMEGFGIWQAWSSKSTKWDDDARTNMLGIWKGFRLEGRALATLDSDIRTVAADPDEFEVVPVSTTEEFEPVKTADGEKPQPVSAGEAVNTEFAWMRETRELMQDHVVLQTGGGLPYFILPGHPLKEIRTAAGLAGVEMGGAQLHNLFGPYLPLKPVGKAMVEQMAMEVVSRAPWRRSVHRMAFRPGGQRDYLSDDGHVYLNAYQAIPVTPIEPRPHEIYPLEFLLKRILDDNDQPTGGVFAKWLLRLYAFVLKNPGVKVKWAPLLYSAEQGTGKTTLMETLPALLFGRQYVKPMVHTVLRERFAGANFDSTWWVCISEMHADAGKVDAKTIANKLKPWITDDVIPIEKKGVDAFEIKNYLQLTAASNHEDCLFMEEGTTDRRWLIGEMYGKALTLEEKTMLNPLFGDDFMRSPKAQGWLHWYFLNRVNIDGFNPSESPPETAAKRRMRENGRSLWEDAIHTAIDQFAPPFDKDLIEPLDITQHLLIGKNVTLAQAKALLTRAGGLKMPRVDDRRNVYCMRNHAQWDAAKPADIKAHLRTGYRPFQIVDDGSDLL